MLYFTIFFPIFFVGFFFLVLYILSKSAWAHLADTYRYDRDFRGKKVGITSVRINGVSYNNCILLRFNHEGFYLRPVFVFRIFHPGVMIPWTEVQTVRDKKILFVKLKELVIGNPAVTVIQMRPITVSRLPELKKFMQ